MKNLFLLFSFLVFSFGCATPFKWVAPQTNQRIPISTTSPLAVNSLPETIVDAVTVFSGSNENGLYVNGDIAVIDGRSYLFSASSLKISPNLIIPVFPGELVAGGSRTGKFKGRMIGQSIMGTINWESPTILQLDSSKYSEFILSGPNGCILKRTALPPRGKKELILVEGEAFLLK